MVTGSAAGGTSVSVATDGMNAYVFYGDTTNLNGNLSGNRKLVYKKGIPPFTTTEFDPNPTTAVSSEDIFDKVWSYYGSAYTDVTTAASNTTLADTQMVRGVGDMIYFGKTTQFDSLSWYLSTNGGGGAVAWEYWNGTTWATLTLTTALNINFLGTGYAAFTAPADWAATSVNGTSEYYVRARVSTLFSTAPVATQIVALSQINWINVIPTISTNTAYALWGENAGVPMKVREAGISIAPSVVNTSAATDLTEVMGYSTISGASQPSTMHHMVKTSDGTIHAFIQSYSTLACGGSSSANNGLGLEWVYSTDGGTTWTCGGLLIAGNASANYFASATVDSSDNIYVIYSTVANGGSTLNSTYYRKLTKGSGSTWTLGAQQSVLSSSATTGYTYSVAELEGSTRLWMATRYFDGTNYQISVYYSDGLTDAPVWTQSSANLDTVGNNASYHFPAMVRYGSSIGIIYNDQTSGQVRWRYRNDGDTLTNWSNEAIVGVGGALYNPYSATFSAVGDASGNVYFASNYSNYIFFSEWNGLVWTPAVAISTTAISSFVSVSTDGTNAWVFYADATNLNGNLSGNRALVYKKGSPPFSISEFDLTPTPLNSYNTIFDKVWSYYSGVYTNTTTAAGNTTVADTQMVSKVGDVVYFGKTAKFDSVSFSLSTYGVGGEVAWEYWNGSSWMPINNFVSSYTPSFSNNGYINFIPNTDWTTTSINGEGTPYYYVRARVVAAFTTAPVATQFAAITQINWMSVTPTVSTNSIYTMWTENGVTPMRVKNLSVSVTTTPVNSAQGSNLINTVGYSTTNSATAVSTMSHIVRTSDGTLHAFMLPWTGLGCAGSSNNNNALGLEWLYSTDNGSTWTCGGQIAGITAAYYASATVDSSDNIYLTYSNINGGANALYQVFYRKLTKGVGSTWTVGPQQLVLDSSATTGYSYSTIGLDGSSRLWLAVRYFDGSNYQIPVYYSDGLTSNPTWTQSTANLETPGGNASYHVPTFVRFGTKIGFIYSDQIYANMKWRYRDDSDPPTTWSSETYLSNAGMPSSGGANFSAVGDTNGNVYFAENNGSAVYFTYWNGLVWSPLSYVTSTAVGSFASVMTDGSSVWVFYSDGTGLNGGLYGNRKIVYKKGIAPFTSAEFDANPTPIVSYQGIFDKYWSYYSGVYTDDTTDAGSVAVGDTQLVSKTGDISYFGKTSKFDSVSWMLSTAGVNGKIAWEYWNGSSWMPINHFISSYLPSFTGTGYIQFMPNSDWATTTVNGESTPYYYIRARVIADYTVAPIGTQVDSVPSIFWAGITPTISSNTINVIWTEGYYSPVVVREANVSVTTSTANSASSAELSDVVSYSSTPAGTAVSTQRHIVKTSDGTLHTFVQAAGYSACKTTIGLVWLYSTDAGKTWSCGGQLSGNYSILYYASATVDSSDNIYVVYSVATTGGNAAYDVFYRKLTKETGSNWTLGAEQTVLNSTSATTGYSYANIEADGAGRLWLAARYFDGTNYQISVYYSSDMSDAPTWTVSQAALDTPGTNGAQHFMTVVKFAGKIGIIYNAQSGTQNWRYRNDADGPTTWSAESVVANINLQSASFSTVGDTSGNIYHVMNFNQYIYFTYWNGASWSSLATVSNIAAGSAFTSVLTYGGNVWVVYGETTGLNGNLTGSRKLVYKKGVSPFATANFDTNSTQLISYHNTFDKYWSYVSSSYVDDTADALDADSANTASSGVGNDVQMVSNVGDVAYFGKTYKFDTVAWALSTYGVGGQIAWEYWNGTSWVAINHFVSVYYPSFLYNGFINFTPNSDWATTKVNGEATAYYYVRARVVTAFTTAPVGYQLSAIPQINWAGVIGNTNSLYVIWTENSVADAKMNYTMVEFPNPPYVPSSLGPSGYVGGGAVNHDQPTLQFNLSDFNTGDTVQYRIQIATSADFSSLVVDYTSALATQGAASFTVGQAAGPGTYAVGSVGQLLAETSYYWRVMATDDTGLSSAYATANNGSVAFTVDVTKPNNASSIVMDRSLNDITVANSGWTKDPSPYFSWTAGSDNQNGTGIQGYCLYLGQTASTDPTASDGILGTGPATSSDCPFITTSNSIDFSDLSYRGSPWLTTSPSPYYLNLKTIDNAGNISTGSAQFEFYYDDVQPTNVSYISPAAGNYSNVVDMSFSWPTTGSSASSDDTSGILGWQYQMNSLSGNWQGSSHSAILDLDYIPATASAYILVDSRDGSSIVTGENTIYFRAVDAAGNTSSDSTIRTGNIYYAGAAPTFGALDSVTVTPSSAETNSFAMSWPTANAGGGQSVAAYYYMVNTLPPATYATISNNPSTYINNGAFTSVSARSLPNVNRGTNTIYVVAVDNANPPNYSPSNYIKGTFTLNSSNPDNIDNLVISDSSIKSTQEWSVTLKWTAPIYQGAGNLTYLVYRSEDGINFDEVNPSNSLYAVDQPPESKLYYYKIYTKDGAGGISSGSNAVSIIPTGKWTSAPTLESDPTVSDLTTKTATISWSTSRTADSKVQYGTSSGNYLTEEPSNSNQVTAHSIDLSNLSPGTTYYYKVKWTDEDGNTGTSSEFSFTTAAAPYTSNVQFSNININSAYVTFTIANANSVNINYGPDTSYGGVKTLSTSQTSSTYTVLLDNLTQGTTYHLRISAEDTDGNTYNSDDYTFATLPTPKVNTLTIQQVVGLPTATLRILWSTNTLVTSIVTYYPTSSPDKAVDQVALALATNHSAIIKNLQDQTDYTILVKGKDSAGNEITTKKRSVTTLADTRPPEIQNLNVESTVTGVGDSAKAQIIVTWDTDEPATTQVEYAQGTGVSYGQTTQEDTNLTTNHSVTVTGLTPAKIYHLRADSKDKAGNLATSPDTVIITPKSTKDALTLVIENLSTTFGFLNNLGINK